MGSSSTEVQLYGVSVIEGFSYMGGSVARGGGYPFFENRAPCFQNPFFF
jgi:hypothetical protein